MRTEGPQTLDQFLCHLAERFGDHPAIVVTDHTATFHDVASRASLWQQALQARGYGKGDHIGLLAANRTEWLEIAFGVWASGATLVPLSTFSTPTELIEVVEHADVRILLAQSRIGHKDLLDGVRNRPRPPQLNEIVALDRESPGITSAATFLERQRAATSPEIAPEDTACILYTSGTTGRAKGVMLSHRALLATIEPTAARSGLAPGMRMFSTLPLFWVAGLVIRALPTLASGATLVLTETFKASDAVGILRKHRPAGLHLRPPQIGEILAHSDFTDELFECVERGNGRRDWFQGYLPERARLITGYGMTEMAGYVTALDFNEPEDVRAVQIGTPLPGVRVRIVDGDAHAVPPGETGNIQVDGPGMFTKYYKEDAALGRTSDGWFDTGDLGSIDPSGTFHFAGRSKDLLRVKGINVSPVEVEATLGMVAGVEAAYVVGVPWNGLEQEIVALIVLEASSPAIGAEELARRVSERLSHYKRPARYLMIDRSEVPLGRTSKPIRRELTRIAQERIGTTS